MVSPRPPMPPVTTAMRCFAMTPPRGEESLHHVHSTIDADIGAGDVARLVGGQEGHYRGDFLGPRQTPHRDRGDDLLADLGTDRLHHVGLDIAWGNRVYVYALLPYFLGQRLREA